MTRGRFTEGAGFTDALISDLLQQAQDMIRLLDLVKATMNR